MHERPPSVLTIAGSDSGGGAGIQADLKTFAAHGVHGLSVITALTAQNTRGVTAIHVPDAEFLNAQLEACFDDFDIRAVKIGMLASAEVIEAVIAALQRHQPANVVLDPVMLATTGAALLRDDALQALRTRLLPMADLVTPNIQESDWLLRFNISDAQSADRAARMLQAGTEGGAVLLKGGHLHEGDTVIDRYCDADGLQYIAHPRQWANPHGTGCTLSSAIAANLCLGMGLFDACRHAADYVARALAQSSQPGMGDVHVLRHVMMPDAP